MLRIVTQHYIPYWQQSITQDRFPADTTGRYSSALEWTDSHKGSEPRESTRGDSGFGSTGINTISEEDDPKKYSKLPLHHVYDCPDGWKLMDKWSCTKKEDTCKMDETVAAFAQALLSTKLQNQTDAEYKNHGNMAQTLD